MTETPSRLAAALVKLQTQLPEIKKSETAKVETQKGSYSYTYADLFAVTDAIFPALAAVELAFIAKPTFSGDRFVLAYSLLHVSGEREDGEYPLPTTGTPQAIGSAITYGRRYCLCAVTGVAPEEDDDAAAAEAASSARRGTAQRAKPQQRESARGQQMQRTSRPPGQPPPLPGDDAANSDGITRPQISKIGALMQEQGLTDRDDALAYVAGVIGRHVGSRNELTKTEASAVIDALEADKASPDQDTLPDAFPNEARP